MVAFPDDADEEAYFVFLLASRDERAHVGREVAVSVAASRDGHLAQVAESERECRDGACCCISDVARVTDHDVAPVPAKQVTLDLHKKRFQSMRVSVIIITNYVYKMQGAQRSDSM